MHQSRLLVIEDDRLLRTLLEQQLHSAGYQVHLAGDGQDGLDITRTVRPDLVLCDWVMPRLDGIEYCRSVKADPELKSTYIALITSRNESSDRVAGLDAGADDLLIKPLDTQELLARVRSGLRIRELQRELSDARHGEALLEMAATLGHEINNPLTALFGHLELLMQYVHQGDAHRVQHHVGQAGEIAGRIAEVAQRLITLRSPQTKSYIGKLRMLDLERA